LTTKPIVIIPARGNSKRLARKNILPWQGIPLIAHTIKNTIASNIFSKVIVSSEDDEILECAVKFGAEPFKRNFGLSKDTSTVVEVCTDVINQYKDCDYFCCIYATAVKLQPSTIRDSFFDFNKNQNCNFLMGVSLYNYPPQQALIQSDSGTLTLLNPQFRGVQSQHFQNCFVSNGTLYWSKTNSFLKEKTFYGNNLRPFVVPETQVSDINTVEDYKNLQ
jgi:N-acylneuraminate cytidylyltransferase